MKLHTRLTAVFAAATLCSLTLVASPAQAAVSPSATDSGTWLAGQLTNGLMHNPNFGGFDDYGLTLDTLMALQEADTRGPAQNAIVTAMSKNIKNYVFNFPSSGPGDGVWAGSAAKSLVAVQAAQKDAASFGGVDLVATVEGTVESAGADKGRLKDRGIPNFGTPGSFDDYSNLLYQAYGLQGLADAKSAKVSDVRDFLLKQQCKAGYFRLYFDACKADTDATAIAVRAMMAAKTDGVGGLEPALKKATMWLVGQQRSDGSFGGGELTSGSNTNSTGLAASALALRGKTSLARKAAAWIYTIQVKPSMSGKLASEQGAVALSADSFKAGQSGGITATTQDEWRRATTQASYGLIHLDPSTINTRTVTKIIRPRPIVRTVKGATVAAPAATTEAAQIAEATTPAAKLGQYVSGQLTNGDHIEVKKGSDTFVDYDLTARAVLGLRQLGQQSSLADRTTKFLFDKESIAAYAHGAPYEKNVSYAGPLAKLIIAGSVATKTDSKLLKSLADELSGLQQTDGSFKDKGKYADRIGDPQRQVFATIALRMAGDGAAADKAVGFIEKSHCDDGGFGTSFGVVCTISDPAATGWALQALGAVDAADLPASSMLADLPDGWDADRVTTIEAAARSLRSVVHVDGSVDGADGSPSIPTTAAVAAGRQTAGFDTGSAARFVASRQLKNGGLGGKTSDLDVSLEAAPAIGASSLMAMARSNLSGGLSFPLTPAPVADATAPRELNKTSDDFAISRPAAYAGGGVLGVLILVSLGIGIAGLTRKRGPA